MNLHYGEDVVIVDNTLHQDNAAFKRFKKGIKEVYRITWTNFRNDRFEIRRVRDKHRLDNYTYEVSNKDVIPAKFFEKKLEDYL